MTENKIEDMLRDQQFEQWDAVLMNMAKVLARYYSELVNGGVSPDVAALLLRDLQTKAMSGVQS